MNRDVFFAKVTPIFGGIISVSQVQGTNAILDALKGWPIRYMAYGLATAFHEVGRTMQPVREGFKTTDAAARTYVKKHYGSTYGKPVGPHKQVYYGRGYVQLTWLKNYERASELLGRDCVREPDIVLEPEAAALIMRDGMEKGWFTGRKLGDYLDKPGEDRARYVGARRVINGTDKATLISGYAMSFEAALRAAGYSATNLDHAAGATPVGFAALQPATPPSSTYGESAETPVEPAPAPEVIVKNTPISPASRTAQGTVTAGASGLVVAGSATAEMASKLQEANAQISGGTWLLIAAGALTVIGAAYAFYARWRDGGGLFPWEKA